MSMDKVRSLTEVYGEVQARALLEAWAPYLDSVREVRKIDDNQALGLAILLENTRYELGRFETLFEATQPADVGIFKKYAFDLVSAVFPSLIAEEIVSVQPLRQKIGQIFYLKYLYGTAKGAINKGDVMFSPFAVGNGNYNYTSEIVEDEPIGVSGQVTYSGLLPFIPVRPGTVKFTDGTFVVTDDSNGKLVGAALDTVNPNTNKINYETGAYEFKLTTAASSDVVCSYEYNLETVPSVSPEITLKVDEILVTARPRKLRALYAFDAAYDLKSQHGQDIDTNLLEAAVAEIRHETDAEIMDKLFKQAALSISWDAARPAEISLHEHYQSFVATLTSASNMIFQVTRRCVGNFVVAGKTASDVIESLGKPRWEPAGVSRVTGPHYAGTLDGKWKVYKNPFYGENDFLVGYRGEMLLDAGFIYAPYLPVFATSLIMLDDFIGRRGFASSYAQRMVNPNLYVKGTITPASP